MGKLTCRRILTCLVLALSCVAANALESPNFAVADSGNAAIAQGFQTTATTSIAAGALVSTAADNPHNVLLATTDSSSRLIGVVDVNPLISLSSSINQVQVVLSGTSMVLVSDINGTIRAGDKITPSPISGVGMVATDDAQVVGTAQSNLDTKSATAQKITDRNGVSRTVRLGKVQVQVNVAYYQVPNANLVPPSVQKVVDSIAGRPVSLIRTLASGLVLVIGLIGSIVIMNSSIRSSMEAMGRNPLARGIIRKGLLHMIFINVILVIGMLLAAYLILRL